MAMLDLELFKGKISNVEKRVLTHTSGEIGSTNIRTKTTILGERAVVGGGGGGKIETTHEHYTDFNIGNTAFRCGGDYIFKKDDNIILYAYPTNQGFYQVEVLKNITRNFRIWNLKEPKCPLLPPILSFIFGFLGYGFLGLFGVGLIKGILAIFHIGESISDGSVMLGAFILVGFFGGIAMYRESEEKRTNYPKFKQKYDEIIKEFAEYKG